MTNLLSPQQKSLLRWRGITRFVVTLTGMSVLGILLIAAAFLPAAIYGKVVLSGLKAHEGVVEVTSSGESLGSQRQALVRQLRREQDSIESVLEIATLPNPTEVLNHTIITAQFVSGVQLRSVLIDGDVRKGVYIVRMSGVAGNRGDIVLLQDVFEKDAILTLTEFPLGNLTPQGEEYNFTLEVETMPDIIKKENE
jgi:hypothetical protein